MPYRRTSVRALPIVFLLTVASLFGGRPGLCAETPSPQIDIFTVSGIQVDATAKTAAEARQVAIAQGRAEAWRRMLEKLTLQQDHDRLPAYDPARAARVIEGFRVDSEKTSDVRYIGRLSYVFRPERVRQVLREAGIPFAETASKPVVVLPVWRANGTDVLWDDPNPWRAAWNAQPANRGLVPLLVPLGDLTDMSDIDAQAAIQGDVKNLARLTQRYDAKEALVAIAENSNGTLKVTARSYGVAENGSVVATWSGSSENGVDQAMATAIGAVDDQINEQWKQRNLLGFGSGGTLVADVPFTNLAEWRQIAERLQQVAPIRTTQTLTLVRGRRRIEINYMGSLDQLRLAMQQSDLVLEPAAPGFGAIGAYGGGTAAGTGGPTTNVQGSVPQGPGVQGPGAQGNGIGDAGAATRPARAGLPPDTVWVVRLAPGAGGPGPETAPGEGGARGRNDSGPSGESGAGGGQAGTMPGDPGAETGPSGTDPSQVPRRQ